MKKLISAVVVALLAVGCKGPTDPSDNQVETFSGTVNPRDIKIDTFTIGSTGELTVKLKALSPGNVPVGVLYGQNLNGNCQPAQNNYVTSANIDRTIISTAIYIKGGYCIAVFDPVGVVTSSAWPGPQTYTIEVSHP